MVLGSTSGAGKSWLATALCRWYVRRGLRVAPFKAQNLSKNARVTPAVRHNAVLLKPETDTRSQDAVFDGQADVIDAHLGPAALLNPLQVR